MKKNNWVIPLAAGAGAAVIAGVAYGLLSKDIPKGAVAVQPFDKDKFMGTWNEIARLPSIIEKNISQLTEEYSPVEDGMIKVVTKGYNYKKDKWTEMEGKIKFAGSEDIGMLKVSYLGPLYLSYNVLDIDAEYRYMLVSGSGLDYLWLMSKESTIPDDVKERFITKAKEIGFAVDKLEWPDVAV
jgi:apolipoprotein D and lipocalin family protein